MLPHVPVVWERQYPSILLLGRRVASIAGVSFHQPGLAALVSAGGLGTHASFYAWLVREPHNPHDSQAVAVVHGLYPAGGTLLGHLKRELAAVVAPEIDAIFQQTGSWPTCLASAYWRAAADAPGGGLVVGRVFGPWPELDELSWSADEPPSAAPSTARTSGTRGWAWRSSAIDRVQKGMTREQLVAAVGEEPGKVEERVTKTSTKHVLQFVEDVERNGRYLLKVTLEDGVVTSWTGVRE